MRPLTKILLIKREDHNRNTSTNLDHYHPEKNVK